ncbi:MAG TPA: PHB depolymerase family esterase [candidate division Zixibacteria bacterium]|nr:PHB depolymerase family esterase [candidate division Zixibacteria bacterium]
MHRRLPILALLLLAACAGSPVTRSTPPASGEATAPPAGSSGAPATASPAPVEEMQVDIAVGEDERTVRVLLPSLTDGELAPMLVLLHGNPGTTSEIRDQARATTLAARHRVVVVMPPARDQRWDAIVYPGDEVVDSPDVPYVAGVIAEATDRLPVDPERVFVAGMSMGAVLADRIACEAGDRITAIAVVAGTPWSDRCTPGRPISVLVLHGTADGTFPLESAEALAARWRDLDGCDGTDEVALAANAVAIRASGCTDGAQVELVRIEGAAHAWFREPDATELAWRFFSEVPR